MAQSCSTRDIRFVQRHRRGKGRWDEGEVMEGGFMMLSLLRNFTARVNSQNQLGKGHSERAAYPWVFSK